LASTFLTYHYEQEIVQIFTHVKLTSLTLLTYIQFVSKFQDFL